MALLRGINVGGRNPVAMADLRAAFEAAGYTSVRTYIQSGNVLFETGRARVAGAASRRRSRPASASRSSSSCGRAAQLAGRHKAPEGFGPPDIHHSDVIFLKGPLTAAGDGRHRMREGVDRAWPAAGSCTSRD